MLWSLVVCGVGLGLFVYGFRLLQRRRLILDTPFSKIRSASLGMVELSGLAVGPYTMIAPITGRPCYYYRTLVWEWKQSGKNKDWVKVAGECMHVPFFVDDNTGRALIDPRGADLDIHRDFEQQFNNTFFSLDNDAPGAVNAFLSRHGVVTSNKIKVEEYCIKPKNSLFILGTLAENPGIEVTPQPIRDPESSHSFSSQGLSLMFGRDTQEFEASSPVDQNPLNTREIIQLSPVASQPLKATDMTQQQKVAAALLKAGISNPAAWAAARVTSLASTAGVQVIAEPQPAAVNEQPDADPSSTDFVRRPPVVLMRGSNNKTFLISWRSQQQIARSLGWKCSLMIWGGPVLVLLGVYVFLSSWHLL